MKLENNTVLITGGSSGLGLELSKELFKRNNRVIICGRSVEKLKEAKTRYPELDIYPCDISDKQQCEELSEWIMTEYPNLNILINNAAIVNKTGFFEPDNILEMAEQELSTNFMAPLRLIKHLAPTLQSNPNSAIINITTGLIYTPRADYPFYNATKAALHSFTQVLRFQMKGTDTKVIEVMYPAVNTPWHNGNPPKISISAEKAISEMIKGWEKGKDEIRVGGARLLYRISRMVPGFAFKKVNSLENEA